MSVLLLLVVLGTFWPAVHNSFVGYDDPDYVTGNWRVQQGLTRGTIQWAFSASEAANWHPLTWISHALDWEIFGPFPWGHHLTSIMLHAANATLCFLALKSLTRALWRSFAVALLFGLHPLRVESVAWIAERKDVLSAFFFFLVLLAYAPYARGAEAARGALKGRKDREVAGIPQAAIRTPKVASPHWRYYILGLALFLLGLMSKPMLVTLPFVLLLLDYWPLRRFEVTQHGTNAKKRFLLAAEKLPFLLAALAICFVTFFVQRKAGAMSTSVPIVNRLENAAISYCRYLGKTFIPIDLAVFYPPIPHWPLAAVIMALFALAAVTFAALTVRRSHPYVAVGWFWFVGMLVPVIGLVQVGEQSMADRYTYLPSVGVLMMLAWGIPELTSHWPSSLGLTWATTVAVIGCILLTRQTLGYWEDTSHLFRHALSITKGNYLAHNNLGTDLDRRGLGEEAVSEFQQALACKPNYPEAHKNLGVVLERQGRIDLALQHFQEALKLKPDFAEALNGIGSVLVRQGNPEEAMRYYERAITAKSDSADAHFNLAILLQQQGKIDQAVSEFGAALKSQPDSAETHNSLGVALERKGRLDEAIEQYSAALRLRPDYARAHFNLGVAMSRKGLLGAAIAQYQEALKFKPDYGAAQTNLAILLEMKKAGQVAPQP